MQSVTEWVQQTLEANACVRCSKHSSSDGMSLVGDVLHTTRKDQLVSLQVLNVFTKTCVSTEMPDKCTGRLWELFWNATVMIWLLE